MAQKAEIKVEKPIVFDSKLDTMVRKTTQSAGDAAASLSFEAAYLIKLTPTLKFDDKAREIVATCAWQIYEGGGSLLFAALKQTKISTGRATTTRDKVTQRNLDDTIGAVTENEVTAIMKALKAMK